MIKRIKKFILESLLLKNFIGTDSFIMKDIEIVLENLASQEIMPDKQQRLFLEAFIEFDSKYKHLPFFVKTLIQAVYIYGAQLAGARHC